VAAWMRYVGGVDEAGQPIDVRDPMAAELRALSDAGPDDAGKVAALLGVARIFPADLARTLRPGVTQAYLRLKAVGARAAAQEIAQ